MRCPPCHWQLRLTAFDPLHPNEDELPAVGDYVASYGGLPSTVKALHALSPPATEAGAWKRLLGIADRPVDNAQRQIRAARAEDVGTFVTTVHTSDDLIDALNSAGQGLGYSEDSPCHQVFG